MAEDGREAGRRGWVQAAMAWFFGPQQDQQRWQQNMWQSGGSPEGQPVEDPTPRHGEILAQARATEPPRYGVPLMATPQTSPQMAETERVLAAPLAIIQDAILAEQQRRQQGR